MPVFRLRTKRFEAFTRDDGRVLIADDPPRYMSADDFAWMAEPADDTRTAPRRKKARVTTLERRRGGRRRRAAVEKVAAESRGTAPAGLELSTADKRELGLAMFRKNASVSAVAAELEVTYQTAWSWRRSVQAERGETTKMRPSAAKTARAEATERSWMDEP